jgi:CubicO group peptidase (beta-lactamase class C family)
MPLGSTVLMRALRVPVSWLGLAAALVPIAVTAQVSGPTSELLDRIDAYVERERQASRIPGIALAIVRHGNVVHARGFGNRGRENEPITAHTPFPIGSLTKSFTATLVRQLAGEGRLDVDAPVQRYLPWFTLADAAAASRITVAHLLTQTSGLSRDAGMQPLLQRHPWHLEQLRDELPLLAPRAAPGERFEYSNLNYVLLGAIVQAVSGQPWASALRAGIVEPLGLSHTHTDAASARADGMTATHRYFFGVPVRSTPVIAPDFAATGAIVASAQDMGRYAAAALRAARARDRRDAPPPGPHPTSLTAAAPPSNVTLLGTRFAFRYGEGWFVGPFAGRDDARWHLGNLDSFAAWIVLLPRTDDAMVLMMNANSELPWFGISTPFSRIPLGVVQLLDGKQPDTGPSVTDGYLGLEATLISVSFGLAVLSWWVALRRAAWPAVVLAGVAMVAATMLAFTPFGWRGFAQFVPDLIAWLAAMLAVMVLPITVKLARAAASARRSRPGPTVYK